MGGELKLNVSASPHIRFPVTSQGIMRDVIIALVPAFIASVVIFGPRALAVTAITVASCLLFEYLSRKAMKRNNTLSDLTAVITGLLLAFNLPVSIPYWMCVVGAAVAIIVAKQMFGGVGQNFVNPALAGRIVLLMSFAKAMATWTAPLAWRDAEAVTTATPLAILSGEAQGELPSLLKMFIGLRMGSMGEVCAAAILLGGLYLIIRKVISPVIPLTYIGTFAILMLIFGKFDFEALAYQILSGGLLLGAFFMATDYSTSPINMKGRIIFGIGCGLLTALIRQFGSLPEGVSFAIFIMNILVPHIENITTPKPFGEEKKTKGEAKA